MSENITKFAFGKNYKFFEVTDNNNKKKFFFANGGDPTGGRFDEYHSTDAYSPDLNQPINRLMDASKVPMRYGSSMPWSDMYIPEVDCNLDKLCSYNGNLYALTKPTCCDFVHFGDQRKFMSLSTIEDTTNEYHISSDSRVNTYLYNRVEDIVEQQDYLSTYNSFEEFVSLEEQMSLIYQFVCKKYEEIAKYIQDNSNAAKGLESISYSNYTSLLQEMGELYEAEETTFAKMVISSFMETIALPQFNSSISWEEHSAALRSAFEKTIGNYLNAENIPNMVSGIGDIVMKQYNSVLSTEIEDDHIGVDSDVNDYTTNNDIRYSFSTDTSRAIETSVTDASALTINTTYTNAVKDSIQEIKDLMQSIEDRWGSIYEVFHGRLRGTCKSKFEAAVGTDIKNQSLYVRVMTPYVTKKVASGCCLCFAQDAQNSKDIQQLMKDLEDVYVRYVRLFNKTRQFHECSLCSISKFDEYYKGSKKTGYVICGARTWIVKNCKTGEITGTTEGEYYCRNYDISGAVDALCCGIDYTKLEYRKSIMTDNNNDRLVIKKGTLAVVDQLVNGHQDWQRYEDPPDYDIVTSSKISDEFEYTCASTERLCAFVSLNSDFSDILKSYCGNTVTIPAYGISAPEGTEDYYIRGILEHDVDDDNLMTSIKNAYNNIFNQISAYKSSTTKTVMENGELKLVRNTTALKEIASNMRTISSYTDDTVNDFRIFKGSTRSKVNLYRNNNDYTVNICCIYPPGTKYNELCTLQDTELSANTLAGYKHFYDYLGQEQYIVLSSNDPQYEQIIQELTSGSTAVKENVDKLSMGEILCSYAKSRGVAYENVVPNEQDRVNLATIKISSLLDYTNDISTYLATPISTLLKDHFQNYEYIAQRLPVFMSYSKKGGNYSKGIRLWDIVRNSQSYQSNVSVKTYNNAAVKDVIKNYAKYNNGRDVQEIADWWLSGKSPLIEKNDFILSGIVSDTERKTIFLNLSSTPLLDVIPTEGMDISVIGKAQIKVAPGAVSSIPIHEIDADSLPDYTKDIWTITDADGYELTGFEVAEEVEIGAKTFQDCKVTVGESTYNVIDKNNNRYLSGFCRDEEGNIQPTYFTTTPSGIRLNEATTVTLASKVISPPPTVETYDNKLECYTSAYSDIQESFIYDIPYSIVNEIKIAENDPKTITYVLKNKSEITTRLVSKGAVEYRDEYGSLVYDEKTNFGRIMTSLPYDSMKEVKQGSNFNAAQNIKLNFHDCLTAFIKSADYSDTNNKSELTSHTKATLEHFPDNLANDGKNFYKEGNPNFLVFNARLEDKYGKKSPLLESYLGNMFSSDISIDIKLDKNSGIELLTKTFFDKNPKTADNTTIPYNYKTSKSIEEKMTVAYLTKINGSSSTSYNYLYDYGTQKFSKLDNRYETTADKWYLKITDQKVPTSGKNKLAERIDWQTDFNSEGTEVLCCDLEKPTTITTIKVTPGSGYDKYGLKNYVAKGEPKYRIQNGQFWDGTTWHELTNILTTDYATDKEYYEGGTYKWYIDWIKQEIKYLGTLRRGISGDNYGINNVSGIVPLCKDTENGKKSILCIYGDFNTIYLNYSQYIYTEVDTVNNCSCYLKSNGPTYEVDPKPEEKWYKFSEHGDPRYDCPDFENYPLTGSYDIYYTDYQLNQSESDITPSTYPLEIKFTSDVNGFPIYVVHGWRSAKLKYVYEGGRINEGNSTSWYDDDDYSWGYMDIAPQYGSSLSIWWIGETPDINKERNIKFRHNKCFVAIPKNTDRYVFSTKGQKIDRSQGDPSTAITATAITGANQPQYVSYLDREGEHKKLINPPYEPQGLPVFDNEVDKYMSECGIDTKTGDMTATYTYDPAIVRYKNGQLTTDDQDKYVFGLSCDVNGYLIYYKNGIREMDGYILSNKHTTNATLYIPISALNENVNFKDLSTGITQLFDKDENYEIFGEEIVKRNATNGDIWTRVQYNNFSKYMKDADFTLNNPLYISLSPPIKRIAHLEWLFNYNNTESLKMLLNRKGYNIQSSLDLPFGIYAEAYQQILIPNIDVKTGTIDLCREYRPIIWVYCYDSQWHKGWMQFIEDFEAEMDVEDQQSGVDEQTEDANNLNSIREILTTGKVWIYKDQQFAENIDDATTASLTNTSTLKRVLAKSIRISVRNSITIERLRKSAQLAYETVTWDFNESNPNSWVNLSAVKYPEGKEMRNPLMLETTPELPDGTKGDNNPYIVQMIKNLYQDERNKKRKGIEGGGFEELNSDPHPHIQWYEKNGTLKEMDTEISVTSRYNPKNKNSNFYYLYYNAASENYRLNRYATSMYQYLSSNSNSMLNIYQNYSYLYNIVVESMAQYFSQQYVKDHVFGQLSSVYYDMLDAIQYDVDQCKTVEYDGLGNVARENIDGIYEQNSKIGHLYNHLTVSYQTQFTSDVDLSENLNALQEEALCSYFGRLNRKCLSSGTYVTRAVNMTVDKNVNEGTLSLYFKAGNLNYGNVNKLCKMAVSAIDDYNNYFKDDLDLTRQMEVFVDEVSSAGYEGFSDVDIMNARTPLYIYNVDDYGNYMSSIADGYNIPFDTLAGVSATDDNRIVYALSGGGQLTSTFKYVEDRDQTDFNGYSIFIVSSAVDERYASLSTFSELLMYNYSQISDTVYFDLKDEIADNIANMAISSVIYTWGELCSDYDDEFEFKYYYQVLMDELLSGTTLDEILSDPLTNTQGKHFYSLHNVGSRNIRSNTEFWNVLLDYNKEFQWGDTLKGSFCNNSFTQEWKVFDLLLKTKVKESPAMAVNAIRYAKLILYFKNSIYQYIKNIMDQGYLRDGLNIINNRLIVELGKLLTANLSQNTDIQKMIYLSSASGFGDYLFNYGRNYNENAITQKFKDSFKIRMKKYGSATIGDIKSRMEASIKEHIMEVLQQYYSDVVQNMKSSYNKLIQSAFENVGRTIQVSSLFREDKVSQSFVRYVEYLLDSDSCEQRTLSGCQSILSSHEDIYQQLSSDLNLTIDDGIMNRVNESASKVQMITQSTAYDYDQMLGYQTASDCEEVKTNLAYRVIDKYQSSGRFTSLNYMLSAEYNQLLKEIVDDNMDMLSSQQVISRMVQIRSILSNLTYNYMLEIPLNEQNGQITDGCVNVNAAFTKTPYDWEYSIVPGTLTLDNMREYDRIDVCGNTVYLRYKPNKQSHFKKLSNIMSTDIEVYELDSMSSMSDDIARFDHIEVLKTIDSESCGNARHKTNVYSVNVVNTNQNLTESQKQMIRNKIGMIVRELMPLGTQIYDIRIEQ